MVFSVGGAGTGDGLNYNSMGVLEVKKVPIIYQGKDYFIIYQYTSGFCEITEKGKPYAQIQLVHSSEIKVMNNNNY